MKYFGKPDMFRFIYVLIREILFSLIWMVALLACIPLTFVTFGSFKGFDAMSDLTDWLESFE